MDNAATIVVQTPISRLGYGTSVIVNGEELRDVTGVHISILPGELVQLRVTHHERDADGNVKLVRHNQEMRTLECERIFVGQLNVVMNHAFQLLRPGR